MIYFVVIPVVVALLGSGLSSAILVRGICVGFAFFWTMTVGLTYASNLIIYTAKQTKQKRRRTRK